MSLLPVDTGQVVTVAVFFRVTSLIGVGRYSEVYAAFDTQSQSDVALKVYTGTDAASHALAQGEAAVLSKLANAGLPFISLLTDPTTGGVTASYAMLGDLNIAEPKALIGFAGQRVIEQTIRQTLPEGFQRSEFLVEHGMVDLITPRSEMKPTIARFLRFFTHKAA